LTFLTASVTLPVGIVERRVHCPPHITTYITIHYY
jgi:hypothetical protein